MKYKVERFICGGLNEGREFHKARLLPSHCRESEGWQQGWQCSYPQHAATFLPQSVPLNSMQRQYRVREDCWWSRKLTGCPGSWLLKISEARSGSSSLWHAGSSTASLIQSTKPISVSIHLSNKTDTRSYPSGTQIQLLLLKIQTTLPFPRHVHSSTYPLNSHHVGCGMKSGCCVAGRSCGAKEAE